MSCNRLRHIACFGCLVWQCKTSALMQPSHMFMYACHSRSQQISHTTRFYLKQTNCQHKQESNSPLILSPLHNNFVLESTNGRLAQRCSLMTWMLCGDSFVPQPMPFCVWVDSMQRPLACGLRDCCWVCTKVNKSQQTHPASRTKWPIQYPMLPAAVPYSLGTG